MLVLGIDEPHLLPLIDTRMKRGISSYHPGERSAAAVNILSCHPIVHFPHSDVRDDELRVLNRILVEVCGLNMQPRRSGVDHKPNIDFQLWIWC